MATLITKSSSSALSLPGGEVSPTSWSSRVVRPITASSSAALSPVAGTVFPSSSLSILLSVQKLSPASSSQIVSSEAALSLTTLSSIVLSAPTFSLKPSLLIVSSGAMLASSPSSKISSGRSFLPIPASSGLSSKVSSFLVSSSAATPTSSPSPRPETFQKLVLFPYLSIVTSFFLIFQAFLWFTYLTIIFRSQANDAVSELDSLNITSNNSLQVCGFINDRKRHLFNLKV